MLFKKSRVSVYTKEISHSDPFALHTPRMHHRYTTKNRSNSALLLCHPSHVFILAVPTARLHKRMWDGRYVCDDDCLGSPARFSRFRKSLG